MYPILSYPSFQPQETRQKRIRQNHSLSIVMKPQRVIVVILVFPLLFQKCLTLPARKLAIFWLMLLLQDQSPTILSVGKGIQVAFDWLQFDQLRLFVHYCACEIVFTTFLSLSFDPVPTKFRITIDDSYQLSLRFRIDSRETLFIKPSIEVTLLLLTAFQKLSQNMVPLFLQANKFQRYIGYLVGLLSFRGLPVLGRTRVGEFDLKVGSSSQFCDILCICLVVSSWLVLTEFG